MDIKDLQKEIAELQKEALSAFDSISRQSRAAKISALAPGSAVPPEGKIYGDDYRNKFEERAAEIRERGYAAIDKAKAEINKAIATAPTQDAAAALSVLALRSNVSQTEIDALVGQYGDNFQSFQAIRDIAYKHNLSVPANDLEQSIAALASETSAVSRLSLAPIEGGEVTPGSIAFREWFNN